MILSTVLSLSAGGLVLWVLGEQTNNPALAVIGGVIVVGVGVMTLSGGIEQRVGKTETQINNNTTEITYQYERVDPPVNLPLPGLITIAGGLLVIQALNVFSTGGPYP